jgi:hypothetical protein
MFLVAGQYLVAPFRQGLDADGVMMMSQAGLGDLARGVVLLGAIGAPFLALGRWLSNRSMRPLSRFPVATPITPTVLMFLHQAWYIVSAAMEPPMNIMPFPPNSWAYLPNWLELAVIALAYLAAALIYLHVARAAAGGNWKKA